MFEISILCHSCTLIRSHHAYQKAWLILCISKCTIDISWQDTDNSRGVNSYLLIQPDFVSNWACFTWSIVNSSTYIKKIYLKICCGRLVRVSVRVELDHLSFIFLFWPLLHHYHNMASKKNWTHNLIILE